MGAKTKGTIEGKECVVFVCVCVRMASSVSLVGRSAQDQKGN